MSCVSDTILVFSICEDEAARIADVNRILVEAARGQAFSINVADVRAAYGGRKVLQTPTYIGAFSYLDIPTLVDGLAKIAWEYPEEVQLLVSDEHDEPSFYTQRYPPPKGA